MGVGPGPGRGPRTLPGARVVAGALVLAAGVELGQPFVRWCRACGSLLSRGECNACGLVGEWWIDDTDPGSLVASEPSPSAEALPLLAAPGEAAEADGDAYPESHNSRLFRNGKVTRSQRRFEMVDRTISAMLDALGELLHRGVWRDGATLSVTHRKQLAAWRTRMQQCGKDAQVKACPLGRRAVVESWCCKVPFCPRHQRRRAAGWVDRGVELRRTLRNEDGHSGRRWKLLTVGLKHSGDLADDFDRAAKMRKALVRWMADRFGERVVKEAKVTRRLDAFGAIEMSGRGHVHLHMLVYCSFVPRELVQGWLKRHAADCTVEGCECPPDDRCDGCRRKKTRCEHPHADGRSRCNGSWYVDLRQIVDKGEYQEKKKRRERPILERVDADGKPTGRSGVVEALKYATAPVELGAKGKYLGPELGVETSEDQLAFAERILRYYLGSLGRHRVETYGRCKERAGSESRESDDVTDSREQESGRRCNCGCGLRMVTVSYGLRVGAFYEWLTRGDS